MESRNRFIKTATMAYSIGASAWILLSDSLANTIAGPDAAATLATIKGLFFVCATSAGFYFALRAVPHHQATAPMLGVAGAALHPLAGRKWMPFAFAAIITLAAVPLQRYLPTAHLMLFVPGIIASAAFGGLAPGLLSTGLATLAALYLAPAPDHPLHIGLLVLSGMLISLLCGILRTSLRDAELGRRLLDGVLSGTTDAVYIKDLQGNYVYANHAAASFLSLAPEQILGRGDEALFPARAAALLRARDAAVMAGASIQNAEESLATPHQGTQVFLTTCGPLTDTEGNIHGLFGISRNITQRKQAESALRISEERLQSVVNATSDGLWDWDLVAGTLYCTEGISRLCGLDKAPLTLRRLLRVIHRDDAPAVVAQLRQHRSGQRLAIELNFRLQRGAGGVAWVRATGRVVDQVQDGAARRMVGTLSDMTQRRELEQMQRDADTVFAGTHEGIMVVDANLRIERVNPAFERITGYSADEVIGHTPALLASGRHGKAFYRELWNTLLRAGFWRGEIWNARKSGEVYPELLTISAVMDERGKPDHYIGVFSDISHIKAHAAELDRAANFDALTGLPNRRLLTDRFEHAIQRANRTGKPLTVCVLDLDNFKDINLCYGKQAGDRLLETVANALAGVVRGDDTLARIGGDEFVLLMSGIGSPEECAQALDRVMAAAATPLQAGPERIQVTASVGVCRYPDDDGDADTLLRHAEQAMYQAKEEGRGCYQLSDPASDRLAQAHRQALHRLRQALDQEEFRLHYQPKVDLRSGALLGVEALIRWQHPERGLLAPGEFLPHVTGTPLETDIGNWVIRTALAQSHAWRAAGLHLQVAVNVGAAQLLAPGFCDSLAAALAAQPGAAPGDLELEVLETAAIADMDLAMDVLGGCHALGVHFALDDFGTGYSSLTYLRKLPVDTLKVDQSFVRNMLADPADHGIVEGVVRLAHAMGLQVVAEGAETAEHCAALAAIGCEVAQGYGIARPMAPELLPAWAAARGSGAINPAQAA
ncbi:EAL domain-containing protein [Pseudoduganella rivuli]|nr:EAL domain-containing protein [Pseudoduganella rivuli]